MTGAPVNLGRARKQRARAEKRADADANALKHGRTKTAKARDAAETEKARTHLDGHKREP